MRAVQPKMKALQERYKDDKVKLQQEMMAAVSEGKDQSGGGLPADLHPDPGLLRAVQSAAADHRNAASAVYRLWIKDLSAPDPLTPVNLFGLLNFTPPAFIALGVLPILLGITMWLQFKLNPHRPIRCSPGLRDHAVDHDVHHGTVRGGLAALLGDRTTC